MKSVYATEQEFLEDFRREQQARKINVPNVNRPLTPPAPAPLVRKHLTGLELEKTTGMMFSTVTRRAGRPFALRRRGR